MDAFGLLKEYLAQSNQVPLAAAPMTRDSNSNLDNWAQAAPVETPAYPSYVADLTMDSTSSKDDQRPQKERDAVASTYLVQSKSVYGRGRQVYSWKKYFSGYP